MKRLVAVVVSIMWLVLLVGGGYLIFTGGVERVLSLLPQDLRDRLGAPVAGVPEAPTSPEEPVGPTEPQPPSSPEAPATATPTPTSPATAPEPTPTATATPTLAQSFVPVAVVELTQLRAGPGPDYSIVGTVDAGSTVALVAQDPSGAWYQLLDGSWIRADALAERPPLPVATPTPAPSTPPPEETSAPAATPVVARVNADANLRAGPGTEHERVGGVRFNEEVRVVGKTSDGQWYLLDTGAWLFSALIDEPLDVPVVTPQAQPTPATPSQATPAPVTNTVANLRAGPGTEFEVVETVPAGTSVTVVGRNPAGDWLRLEDGSWVFAALVDNVPEGLPVVEPGEPVEAATPTPETTATAEATPTPAEEAAAPTPTSAETPVTRVESNLRSGPGLDFQVVRVVPAGTPLTLVGRNEEGDWLRLEDGSWIAFILVDNVPEDLPVVELEEATATPESTATPEDPEPEATPTEEPTPASEGAAKVGGETPAQPVVNRNANLRAGPGTEFEVVETVPAGTPVTVVGRNPAGDWLRLEDGSWVFAALVDNVPEDLPVVEP